jgi:hypothetical protein
MSGIGPPAWVSISDSFAELFLPQSLHDALQPLHKEGSFPAKRPLDAPTEHRERRDLDLEAFEHHVVLGWSFSGGNKMPSLSWSTRAPGSPKEPSRVASHEVRIDGVSARPIVIRTHPKPMAAGRDSV